MASKLLLIGSVGICPAAMPSLYLRRHHGITIAGPFGQAYGYSARYFCCGRDFRNDLKGGQTPKRKAAS